MTTVEFGQAYEGGYQRTGRFLQKLGADRDQATEIANAAWARAWERLSQLRNEGSLCQWVNAIARHLLFTEFREKRLADLSQLNHEPSAPATSLATIEVSSVLAKCTLRHQRLLTAFYWDGFSAHELARQSGRTEGAIVAELYRARHEFREHMQVERRQVSPSESVLRMKVQAQGVVRSKKTSAA